MLDMKCCSITNLWRNKHRQPEVNLEISCYLEKYSVVGLVKRGLSVLTLLMVGLTASADTVWLKDGSVLTGTVMGLDERVLSLQTAYAGLIRVGWGHVRSLSTDRPVWLRLRNTRRERKMTLLSDGSDLWVMSGNDELEPVERRYIAWLGDAPVMEPDSWDFTGHAQLYIDFDRGTDTSDEFNTVGNIELNRKPYRNTISWSSKRRVKNDDVLDDKWLVKYDYNYLLSDTWYTIGNTSVEHNSDNDLRRRWAFGGGVGVQFIQEPEHSLRLELGVSQLWEDFEYSETDSREKRSSSQALHWALKSWKRILDDYVFSHNHDFYKRFGGNRGWLVQTTTGLKWNFTRHFSFNITFDYDYDTAPSNGNSNYEKSLNVGVGYEW